MGERCVAAVQGSRVQKFKVRLIIGWIERCGFRSKRFVGWVERSDTHRSKEDKFKNATFNPDAKALPVSRLDQRTLAELGEKDPKVRSAKAEDFADMSLIKEFDDNGFIDGLYKKR